MTRNIVTFPQGFSIADGESFEMITDGAFVTEVRSNGKRLACKIETTIDKVEQDPSLVDSFEFEWGKPIPEETLRAHVTVGLWVFAVSLTGNIVSERFIVADEPRSIVIKSDCPNGLILVFLLDGKPFATHPIHSCFLAGDVVLNVTKPVDKAKPPEAIAEDLVCGNLQLHLRPVPYITDGSGAKVAEWMHNNWWNEDNLNDATLANLQELTRRWFSLGGPKSKTPRREPGG